MARIVLSHSGNVPEMIAIVAPYMDELLSLRKANEELRFEKYTPNTTLEALIDNTPFRLRQDDDGRWGCTISLADDYTTGVSGQATPEAAFKRALEHVASCWQSREREHREAMGMEDDE
jgi:hypothetical protein